MTTITIENDSNITKTSFKNIDELAEYIYDLYQKKELPELTTNEILEAEKAKQELLNNPESFKRVTHRESI
jgi:hypothetical protein